MAKKNTDETILDVQEVYTKTELFIENNKKTLLGGLGIVVLAILAFFMYNNFVRVPAIANANEEIHMAEMYFMMDSLETSKNGADTFDGLQAMADDHAGSPVGMRANYQLGIINRDNGDYESALHNFKLANFNSPLLGAMTNGNIGDCLVEIGASYEEGADATSKFKEALPFFKRAAQSSTDEVTTQLYYKKAANVCLKLEMFNEAVSMYNGILEASTNVNSAEHKDATKLRAFASAKSAQ
tara:strand:- start:5828 stop:6550 length:723 start_codon:yes stop_codon:yes gene_type:complete